MKRPVPEPRVLGWCFSWGADPDANHERCPGSFKRNDGTRAVCECPNHPEAK